MIVFILLLIIIILVLWILSINEERTTKQCNSNYNCSNSYSKLVVNKPKYKVHSIKVVSYSNKGLDMAKYTLWNFYKVSDSKVEHQELIIYDEIGKYQINDILEFTKL